MPADAMPNRYVNKENEGDRRVHKIFQGGGGGVMDYTKINFLPALDFFSPFLTLIIKRGKISSVLHDH